MNGFRHLAHEAVGLPTSNIDLDTNVEPDTWPPTLSLNNSSQPEPPLQEFGIVSWSDATFSSWGITAISQSLLLTREGEDLLTKPVPLLPLSASSRSVSSTPSHSGSGPKLRPSTRPPSASSNTPSSTTATPATTITAPKPEPQSFLRLLHIPHKPQHSLLINPHLLLRLFHVLDLDPHALYLFHTFTPGFHVLSSSPSSHKLPFLDGQVLRFYLSSNDVTTIWSYNIKRRVTLGVCFVDERMGHKFNVVKYHLEVFRGVLGSPVAVVCADVARACVWRGETGLEGERDSGGLYKGVKAAEKKKGDRAGEGWCASDKIYTDSMELSPVLMETLSRRCRDLGRVSTKAQEAKSSLRLALRMAKQLTIRRKLWRELTISGTNTAVDPITEDANAQIRLLVRDLIIPQLKARIFGWTCRQKEAVVWTKVLMARISRTDASTNHREASSMRVIAVMTMAFLPATFFATLFALPAFQWEVIDGYNDYLPGGQGGVGEEEEGEEEQEEEEEVMMDVEAWTGGMME
ncbi:unnamed protein product [Sordaria macrospora k-hell]|uniref:WGS project CABT00000000 data, contig 2.3 n=1 Tax=Sordaria macrospora (strain ATCC MYA-333 / DSM 997 / K(L3346) / K-hell) TaxID=771870 RepID=F7VQ46_SORMK|nr:uncharacterized protein SMAC_08125 [Sordaria macrospora k-hell]CCC07624.1 unnamed protein product [Sordaria macrospora k-hell]